MFLFYFFFQFSFFNQKLKRQEFKHFSNKYQEGDIKVVTEHYDNKCKNSLKNSNQLKFSFRGAQGHRDIKKLLYPYSRFCIRKQFSINEEKKIRHDCQNVGAQCVYEISKANISLNKFHQRYVKQKNNLKVDKY